MTGTSERRVAIVTGGGRGIGAAVARRLVDDGFAVAIFDLDRESTAGTAADVTAAGGIAIALAIDVSSPISVNETDMTRTTAERTGIPFDEFVADGSAAIPVRRVGQPADVAHLAPFFVSEGKGFVSGQVV